MTRRAEFLEDLAANLRVALNGDQGDAWRAAFDLRVKAGGHQGSVAVIPWVRVYSPAHAPTGAEGVYLTYLFAADGSCAYLSLMHGSSEYRSGSMRAITDARVLHTRVAVARNALGDLLESDGAAGAIQTIDLKRSSVPNNTDRAKAYEQTTILAREYKSGHLPSEDELLADFYGMLPLLARLYDDGLSVDMKATPDEPETRVEPDAPPQVPVRRPTGQGRADDAEIRRQIELHAEDHAIAFYSGTGWKVKRVGQFKRGYDLECTKDDGSVLHVEVKGTRSFGETVRLTANEVNHILAAACSADHALYVVSEIEVAHEADIRCSGGKARYLHPWAVVNDALTPVEYVYTIPDSLQF